MFTEYVNVQKTYRVWPQEGSRGQKNAWPGLIFTSSVNEVDYGCRSLVHFLSQHAVICPVLFFTSYIRHWCGRLGQIKD